MSEPCILFALRREAAPFLREFKPRQRIPDAPCWIWSCGPAAHSVLVVQAGVGARRMERALAWVLKQPQRPLFVLSAGYSGALNDYDVGAVALATEVVDEQGGRWPTTWPGDLTGEWRPAIHRGRVLCVSRLVDDPVEKRRLGQQHDAIAVDMETAVIARLCTEASVPFGCLRVISDHVDQSLDPKLAALLGGRRVSIWNVLKLLLRSPRLAVELIRLARHTRHASRQLGLALGELLTRSHQ